MLKEDYEGLEQSNYGHAENSIKVPEDKIRSGAIECDTGHVVFYVKCEASLVCPLANEAFDDTMLQCH